MMGATRQRPAVVLVVFNRPDLTAQVLAAVRGWRPDRLMVVGDGPRAGHHGDPELVRQTRQVIESVDWPCVVSTCYAEENLGCGERVSSGLDWVFDQVQEAIILEDDCLPDPTFFDYCSQLLARYRAEPRLHMISGCNTIDARAFTSSSYYFSRCYSIWGWATWARAWKYYDYEMRAWPGLRESDWLRHHLRDREAERIARVYFDRTFDHTIRQWDFQWVLCGWVRDALAAVPTRNLVTNLGHGPAGTHLRDPEHPLAGLPRQAMSLPLVHPSGIEPLETADRQTWTETVNRFEPRPGRRAVVGRAAGRIAARLTARPRPRRHTVGG